MWNYDYILAFQMLGGMEAPTKEGNDRSVAPHLRCILSAQSSNRRLKSCCLPPLPSPTPCSCSAPSPTQPLVAGPSVGRIVQKVKFKLEPSRNGQARTARGHYQLPPFQCSDKKLRAERVTKFKGTQIG